MKTVFIETKFEGKLDYSKIKYDELPKKIGLITTVQFVDYIEDIKKYLEEKKKIVLIDKGIQKYPGQILGCEQSATFKILKDVDAFLYIGDGKFHVIGLASKIKKPIYIFNPISETMEKLDKGTIEKMKMKRKAQLMRFYASKEIGVIISTKPGQNHLKEAKELVKKYPEKRFYFLLFDTIDFSQLENFNFIECWINTACPRIEEDISILNLNEIN